ncbi:MAG: GYD domain-containing protein [Nitrospinae bacterium]|nr:GYD domain-containing protein [Nitrospinota bacterium]
MAIFLIVGKFTPQGITNLKQTTSRAERFRQIAEKFGVTVREIFWLMGEYDVINIVEADDEIGFCPAFRVGDLK